MKGWEISNIFESQESFQNLEFIDKMSPVQGVTGRFLLLVLESGFNPGLLGFQP